MTGEREAQLFVVDPITRLRPAKDSSVALMQAAQRAGLAVWVCTQADLSTAADGDGSHRPRAWAQPLQLAEMAATPDGWTVPDPLGRGR